MKRTRLCVLLVLVAIVLAGCFYERRHSLATLHSVGVNWFSWREGTNKVRAFSIGTLDAVKVDLLLKSNTPPASTNN